MQMIMRSMWIGGALLMASLLVGAQTAEPTLAGTRISASAESVVNVKPDQARLSIAVVTEAPTSQDAAAKNAQETEKLIAAIKKGLGKSGEYKTSGYWINPQYQTGEKAKPRISHYVARNSVEVTVNDLAIVGKVIDAATQAGANSIGSLQFSVKDEESAKTDALVLATKLAREKATAMAKALGMQVSRVVAVSDGDAPTVMPQMMMARGAMADSANYSTPVEPGNIEVRSRVTVIVEAK